MEKPLDVRPRRPRWNLALAVFQIAACAFFLLRDGPGILPAFFLLTAFFNLNQARAKTAG